MDLEEFDNVKAEKANAMRRYRRRGYLKWLLEGCAALFVLKGSSTWLPMAVEFCDSFWRQLVGVLRSHLFVFALFNLIIFLVYSLSGKIPTDTTKHRSSGSDDLYEEFVTNNASVRRTPTGRESAAETAPEVVFHDKQIILSDNKNVASPPARNDRQVAESTKSRGAVRTDKEDKALAVECYRRTKSERFKREKAVKRERDFRRSESEIEPGRRSSAVEQMSNDEFKRAIDAFIAAQKSTQREEFQEERKTHGCLTLTSLSVCH